MLHYPRLQLLLSNVRHSLKRGVTLLTEEGKEAGLCLCIPAIMQEAAHSKLIIGNIFSHCN